MAIAGSAPAALHNGIATPETNRFGATATKPDVTAATAATLTSSRST